MSPTDGLIKFATKHIDRMESALVRTMTSRDVDSVHELRVSSRRLSEPLALIRKAFGLRKCRSHCDALRGIRDSLRVVRDIDVLRLALSVHEAGAIKRPTDHMKLVGILAIQRENELLAARQALHSIRVKRVRQALSDLCQHVSRLDTKRDRSRLLLTARRLWERKAEALLDRPPARELGPGLHKTRIRLKAFRYSTELMVRLDGADREDLIRNCTAMQDALGQWNDHFTAARLLSAIARDELTLAAGPEWSASVLEYAAQRARAMNGELDGIMQTWTRLRKIIELQVLGRLESRQATASQEIVADSRLTLERV
ncbi:MAG: CHAD domain-containing protein [Planctomycetes bacterium]|nr:CHAD domain-containing protein [Planctomycetota bacterium]